MNRTYREIWSELSDTEERALMHVAGYTDEESLEEATRLTLEMLRDTIGIARGDAFLEIGCGVGRVGRRLAPLVREWIGCDVAPSMLEHAAKWTKDSANVRLVEISGHDLQPIADNSVDAVYCTVVFMHLDEWDRYAYVREAHRVLKPGGRFCCDNANLESDQGWAVFEAGLAIPPEARPQHISRCSTTAELSRYLIKAGFSEVQTRTPGPWVIAYGIK